MRRPSLLAKCRLPHRSPAPRGFAPAPWTTASSFALVAWGRRGSILTSCANPPPSPGPPARVSTPLPADPWGYWWVVLTGVLRPQGVLHQDWQERLSSSLSKIQATLWIYTNSSWTTLSTSSSIYNARALRHRAPAHPKTTGPTPRRTQLRKRCWPTSYATRRASTETLSTISWPALNTPSYTFGPSTPGSEDS